MGISGDIAASSIDYSLSKVQVSASVATLKNVMDSQEAIAMELLESLADLPVGPSTANVDILA
ncbi:MAG: YjfB family protein [Clostridia bacterium]|nr:YjfB family protein [Clostridia bacterium]